MYKEKLRYVFVYIYNCCCCGGYLVFEKPKCAKNKQPYFQFTFYILQVKYVLH